MKKNYIFITIIFLSSYLLISSPPALAQTGEGLTISPPITELNFDPGKTYKETIKINNPMKDLVTVYPVARNFTASGETGVPAIESPNQDATYGLATWVGFSQTKLALTPEQEIEFQYTITVPTNAEPGGHYAVVLFASEPPSPTGETTQVALASMVGSLVLGTVSGNIVEKGSIVEFSSNGHLFFKPPVNFILRIGNTGNVHFAPQGQTTVTNWGKTVATQDINPTKGNILPNSIRRFEGLKYTGKWYSFGKFNVTLAATYGVGNHPLSGSFSFWIIPWWLITIIVLIIAAIIFILLRPRKKRSDRKKRVILQ